jgi:hypothetical protein
MPAPLPHIEHPQPISVFRIIRHRIIFGKSERGELDIRTLMQWPSEILMPAYTNAVMCFVPRSSFEPTQQGPPNAIVFSSEVASTRPTAPELTWAVPAPSDRSCEILTFPRHSPIQMAPFLLTDGSPAEIHLRYEHMSIGAPSRADFRLTTLEPGQTAEVRINGKLDNSLSSGRARTYIEQAFLITWMGKFTRFVLLPDGRPADKQPTPVIDKHVDLRKPLW